jgi:hypothetical protein
MASRSDGGLRLRLTRPTIPAYFGRFVLLRPSYFGWLAGTDWLRPLPFFLAIRASFPMFARPRHPTALDTQGLSNALQTWDECLRPATPECIGETASVTTRGQRE